jgi:glycosyltransferase involved in cell wall biosynthesis
MRAEGRRGRSRRDGRLTAVTFSRNEAHLLPECLARLTDFDELLVCDMESVDDTVAVATKFGARVLQVPFAPVIESVRQFALDAVETEWVLLVDADERVPSGFKSALAVDELPSTIAGVRLRYNNVAFGVQLAHTLQGSAKYSLLRADLAAFSDGRAHRPPVFDGPVIDAPPSVPTILHFNFRSIPQSLEKVLRYAHSDPRGSESFANPLKLPREIISEVIGSGAWRDGRAGVTLVTVNAIGRFYAAALEWEQRGYIDPGWQPGTRRLLVLGGGLHRFVVWLRRKLGGVGGRPEAS